MALLAQEALACCIPIRKVSPDTNVETDIDEQTNRTLNTRSRRAVSIDARDWENQLSVKPEKN